MTASLVAAAVPSAIHHDTFICSDILAIFSKPDIDHCESLLGFRNPHSHDENDAIVASAPPRSLSRHSRTSCLGF